MMPDVRTTINLDDDVLETTRAIARAERRALGAVVSDLVRRGLVPPQPRIDEEEGFPGVSRAPASPADHGRDGANGPGGSLTLLLDVNVLVSVAWPNHVHHRAALTWFQRRGSQPWATTPFTEAGFVRVSSNVSAIPAAVTPSEAMAVLAGGQDVILVPVS